MRFSLYISSFLLGAAVAAQTLVIPSGVNFHQTEGASITVSGDMVVNETPTLEDNTSIRILQGNILISQPLNFANNGVLSVEGTVNQNSDLSFQEDGNLSITNDWNQSGNFNIGNNGQIIVNQNLFINSPFTSGNNLTMLVLGDMYNASSFAAAENLDLEISGKLVNESSFLAGRSSTVLIVDSLNNSGTFRIGEGVGGSLIVQGNSTNSGTIDLQGNVMSEFNGSFFSSGVFSIAENGEASFFGDVNLTASSELLNAGTINIAGNWFNAGTYSSLLDDQIQLMGSTSQAFENDEIRISNFLVDNVAGVVLTANLITVDANNGQGELEFVNGVLSAAEGTEFVVGSNVDIVGGGPESYFEGPLKVRGSGADTRSFPVGRNGKYGLFEIFEVSSNTEYMLSVEMLDALNEVTIGDSVEGIVPNYFWDVNVLEQGIENANIMANYYDIDFAEFAPSNDLPADRKLAALLYSDSIGVPFRALEVIEELEVTDDLKDAGPQTSTLTTASVFDFSNPSLRFAVGAAPTIVESNAIFAPEAFAPSASDPRNRTYKVFANEIFTDGFTLRIYNRLNRLIFETTDPEEGWNGRTNNTGEPQPAGVYFVVVDYTLSIDGIPKRLEQAIYLAR